MKSIECCKTLPSLNSIQKRINLRMSSHTQNASIKRPASLLPKRVAIIGAGAAGLICARECIREGFGVEIFEKSKHPGGTWVLDQVPSYLQEMNVYHDGYDEMTRTVHSSMYENLRTNIPRHIMGVSYYPFDDHFPGSADPRCFPSRAEVLNYLDAFREEFKLDQYITYESEVVDVALDGSEGSQWKLQVESNQQRKDLHFDAVAVCNGHYSVPSLPQIHNILNFGKPCLHSHLYRTNEHFKNKNVLILGNGPSGRDISLEIADVAKKVYYCGRKWKPEFDLSKTMGLRKNIFLHGNISHCPDPESIQLEDGTLLTDVDEIMLCTGFAYDFPFLKGKKLISTTGSYVSPLYKHCIHVQHPSLAFIGLPWSILPFPVFEFQSKYFVRILSEKTVLPDCDQMMEEIEARKLQLKQEDLDERYFHKLGMDQFPYLQELASVCEDPTDFYTWIRDSYIHIGVLKKGHVLDYRDQPFDPELLQQAQKKFESLREKETDFV